MFEENKTKPSHLTSLATQEYEKRTSKRQARRMAKSIKEHITQKGDSHETNVALFKPNMNLNPLVEETSKTDAEEKPKDDASELYSRPDPEVVKAKTMKRLEESKTENVTAVVNEFFDEEEPKGDGELPNPSPAELTASDDTNKSDKSKDNVPNDSIPDNTTNMEPKDDKSGTTQKNIVLVGRDEAEDEAIDVQLSPTSKDVPASEEIKAEDDTTAEAPIVSEEQTHITEQETVTAVTNEEEGKEEAKDENDDDNLPLIDNKKSATKIPSSSSGKFGLKVTCVTKINTGGWLLTPLSYSSETYNASL